MLKFFKRKKEQPAQQSTPELLGFRLGGSFELNDLKMRMLARHTTFKDAQTIQIIGAVGIVELDGSTVLRYYTDDDGFVQILVSGMVIDENVIDVKLLYFHDTVGISSDSDWNRVLEQDVSQPTMALENNTFTRVWEDSGTRSPPVAMTEKTTSSDGTSDETDQFIMLYERALTDNDSEYLLRSAEEKLTRQDTFDRCLVTSVGIDLGAADYQIIS